MKITNQTADELVLKEGNWSGITVGTVFMVFGAVGVAATFATTKVGALFSLVFFVIGLLIVLFSSSITADLNKATGHLLYQTKRLAGGKNTTYAIADILRIETRKQWQVENTSVAGNNNNLVSVPNEVLREQSFVIFKDGTEMSLDHQKNASSLSGFLRGRTRTEEGLAKQVATFLNVPFQEVAPPGSGIGIPFGPGGIQL